jgi:ABC-type antimicrobial peptide transport system permease subunit
VGVYGVLSYSVIRRRREFAVRMAVGARARAIVGLVLREAFALSVLGLLAGAAVAAWTGRVLEAQLYGVAPHDAITLAVACVALAVAVLAAALGPAVRAVRLRPLDLLRSV